jgi:natural product precursor
MGKVNLNGITKILSEKELKNVMGGSGPDDCPPWICGYGQLCITLDGFDGYCEKVSGVCYCRDRF